MTRGHFRTLVIVNPASAGNATGRKWPLLQRRLEEAIGRFESVLTRAPGQATELCRAGLAAGAELVVAVGGDGTCNEVLGGFFERGRAVAPEAALGLVPHGTGLDLPRTLGLGHDLDAACARLAGRSTRRIDVGWVRFIGRDGAPTERPFVNVTSFGVGGQVAREVAHMNKRIGGKLPFMLASGKVLWRYREPRVRVRVDDGAPEAFGVTNLAVCNARYFGGGMMVAPHARVDDGLFDVTCWSGFSLKDFVLKQRRLYDGSHLDDPRTRSFRARRLAAESDEEVLLEIDGEWVGRLPMSVEILPAALNIKI